jgi:hypothetical protein
MGAPDGDGDDTVSNHRSVTLRNRAKVELLYPYHIFLFYSHDGFMVLYALQFLIYLSGVSVGATFSAPGAITGRFGLVCSGLTE